MAKTKDTIEHEVEDLFTEHWAHQRFYNNCSGCFSERKAKATTHQEMLERYPALRTFNPNRNNPYERD